MYLFRYKALIFASLAFWATNRSGQAADDVSEMTLGIPVYQLGLRSSYRSIIGRYDALGVYDANPDGTERWRLTNSLNGSYRLAKDWEVGLNLPISYGVSNSTTSSLESGTVGNPTLELRFDVSGRHDLVLLAAITPPIGYNYSHVTGDITDDSISSGLSGGPDATGGESRSGASLGFVASHILKPFRLSFGTSVGFPFADTEPSTDPDNPFPMEVRKGTRIQMSEDLAYLINHDWALHGGLRQIWSLDTFVNGGAVDGTASRAFSTTLGVTFASSISWRWGAGFDTQDPFSNYLVNQPYAPSFSVSGTYVGF